MSGAANVRLEAIDLPPEHVFKRDGRSVVWRVRAGPASWVVKRYEYSRARQLAAMALGIHPIQREARMNDRLARTDIDVIPIAARGIRGGRAWLATVDRGTALQHLVAAGRPASRAERDALVDAVIDLWASLVRGGWFFRDFQVANIIVDDDGRPWLIDVGATRRSRSRTHALRMLRQLYETARIEGLTVTDAWRGTRRAAAVWGWDARSLARDVAL